MRAEAVIGGLVSVCLLLPGCRPGSGDSGTPSPKATLSVAAAASMKPAMEAMAGQFEELYPDVEIEFTFGASGALFSQIVNGAPFDLFYSADTMYPQRLVDDGLAPAGSMRVYARGRLALWAAEDSPIDVGEGLAGLAALAAQRIAIANPELAPYGRAAVDSLRRAGVYEAVSERLVMGENVAQAAHFAVSGGAEAAIIPLGLARLPVMLESGTHVEIAPEQHEPIEHAVVMTAPPSRREPAEVFDAFVAGEEGAAILESHGFGDGE